MGRMQGTARSIAVVLFLCLAAACGGPTIPQRGLPAGTLTIRTDGPAVALSVEIAETETSRQIGLMGRAGLDPDAGMVFLAPDLRQSGFWMKNTRIPLSIAFWDAQGKIVDILDMEPCEGDACPLYIPQAPCVGAVEANLGYFETNGISIGDTVELER